MKHFLLTLLVALCWTLPAFALSADEADKMEQAVATLCPLIEQEAYLIAEIRAEKANPSGVVDLRRLHELGDALAATRLQMREARTDNREGLKLFQKWAGKPLDLGFCQSWNRAHD